MKLVSTSFVLLAASAFGATAADLIIDAPSVEAVYSPTYDWTGVYVGGSVGYGVGTVDVTDVDPFGAYFDEDFGESVAVDAGGLVGGLAVGANLQLGAIVLGAEGQVGYLGASGENYIYVDPDNFGEAEFGTYADLTARLGFAADNALFYVKGGIATAEVSGYFGDLGDTSGNPDSDSAPFSTWAFGWTAGAGVEYALDDNWSAKLEYQYYDLGTEVLVNDDGDEAEAAFSAQTVKLGLNYRF